MLGPCPHKAISLSALPWQTDSTDSENTTSLVASTRGSCEAAVAMAATTPDNDEQPRTLSARVAHGLFVGKDATRCRMQLIVVLGWS